MFTTRDGTTLDPGDASAGTPTQRMEDEFREALT